MMSSKACIAASVGAVEGLKDQGLFRWGSAFRLLQQNPRSSSLQAKRFLSSLDISSSSSSAIKRNEGDEKSKQSEESLRKLIDPSIPIKTVDNTPDDPRQRKPDITKAKNLLGWEPKVTLRQGLPLMEEDFRQRLAVPKK